MRTTLAGIAIVVALAWSGCGSDDGAPAAPSPDAGDACKSPHATGATVDDARWCKVDSLLDQALEEPAALPGFCFEVYTTGEDGTPIKHYSRSAGTVTQADGQNAAMSPTTSVNLASASKYLTALTVLRAISKVALAASKPALPYLDTPVSALGCQGVDPLLQQATLSQVLHQIAGLSEDNHDCLQQIGQPISSCACQILVDQYAHGPPGTKFVYGAASFVVAAAMAEKLAGVGFRDQIDSLAGELGVPASQLDQPLGYNFAGGFSASVAAYLPFLALASRGSGLGKARGTQLIDPGLLDAMADGFAASVVMQLSPFVAGGNIPVRYGLGSWVHCSKPWESPAAWPTEFGFVADGLDYDTCPKKVQHSLGMFGFMPWVSFPKGPSGHGHVALLGTHIERTGSERVSFNSFMTFLMIEPLLDELLP
jgi:CubicO group peptidase (beta-lactamase class C family)